MVNKMNEVLLFELNLAECPVGYVLDKRNPDKSVDEKYFRDVETPLNHPYWNPKSTFRVLKEAGERRVLEHWSKGEGCLLTGNPARSDYTIEVKMRKLMASTLPNADDEYRIVSRSGIVFRHKTLRRYYFYCIEGFDRLALYRREDDTWMPLEEERLAFDKSKYYSLKVECYGDRMRCYLDDSKVFEVIDDAYDSGKVGIRVNTVTRFYDWKIYTTKESAEAFERKLKAQEAEMAKLSSKYPKPTLWKALDLSRFGLKSTYKFGSFSGEKRILIIRDHADLSKLALVDLNGNIIWENEYPEIKGPAISWNVKMSDMDGDGDDEVAVISPREKIAILDGSSGKVLSINDSPRYRPYASSYEVPAGNRIYICNLSGSAYPSDIVVFDGDSRIWAYDKDLSPLWSVELVQEVGHHINFWDVDGDGKEETLIGYNLVDDDGTVLWQVEGAEYFDRFHGGRHADCVAVGEFDGDLDTVEAALAAGGEGFLLVDGRTGKIKRRHRVGHAQCLSIGKYRADLPGVQIWVGTRHANYGILSLFTGSGDKLCTFEPDNIGQGGIPVNWSGDGEELLLIWSSKEALGLYDGYGRKVVSLPEEPLGGFNAMDLIGDRRDEIISWSNGVVYIYTQDKPYPEGEMIYAPIRAVNRFEHPVVSLPNWIINRFT